jgi:glutathione transport system ATP-binding protein
MMMPTSPVLSVDGLTVEFNGFRAVDGVSLHVHKGQTVALVGESGSGKSVTGLSIMRLLDYDDAAKITAGSATLYRPDKEPVDLLRLPLREMREFRGKEVTMIFQEPLTCLNPAYSIGEQIAESVRIHLGLGRKAAWERAVQIMDTVRIPDAARRAHEYPHQMSGGMRQRVMIGMAVACNPRVLIADEPTTALDVTVQAQVLTLLAELQDEFGMGIIFVTHDMAIVGDIADEVVVMRRAKVVEQGPTAELFAHPQHPYTRALFAAVPKLGAMTGTTGPEKFVLAPGA